MTARRPIRIMPPDLALKIAAGEVAERPASVVKELIDNAVDAGARSIKVEVREAGLKMIRVTDNGCGIAASDLPLAFTSHATSKIAHEDDLEHLSTLGFRGEALPSIAAVSRVEVQSRPSDEMVGSRFAIEHGEVVEQAKCSAASGTRLTVLDLFSNVPARRAFVRSLRAEGGQITQVVAHYALAQPYVQFSLVIEGKQVFHSPGTGKLADAVAEVYGASILEEMFPIEARDGEMRLIGMISTPRLSRQNRTALTVAVNGRPIGNRSLGFALEEAYSGYLMVGRHPLAAILLSLPPHEVDPNIHPAKNEVRFARDREVHRFLYHSVSGALLDHHMQTAEPLPLATPEELTFDAAPQPLPLEQTPAQSPLMPAVPALRVFGQSNATFIIAEGPDGLYMIDQHAAHERVLFDQFDQQLDAGTIASQPLLEPATVDLSPRQMLALDENGDLLARAGFVVEPFGDSACLVRAVPSLARSGHPEEMVREVLSELENVPEPATARERALASMACRAAVKAGQILDTQEMLELVLQLERTLRPATCPHGRPTMIHLSHTQLEREFGRR